MTPTEAQTVARAAKRFGLSDPSFDDVLMELTPDYGECPHATRRWRELKNVALTLVDASQSQHGICPVCKVQPITHRSAQSCSRECGRVRAHEKMARRASVRMTKDDAARIRELHAKGWTPAMIAEDIGRDRTGVARWLKNRGITRHSNRGT